GWLATTQYVQIAVSGTRRLGPTLAGVHVGPPGLGTQLGPARRGHARLSATPCTCRQCGDERHQQQHDQEQNEHLAHVCHLLSTPIHCSVVMTFCIREQVLVPEALIPLVVKGSCSCHYHTRKASGIQSLKLPQSDEKR